MSAEDIGTREWSELIRKPPGWVMVDPQGRVEGVIGWKPRTRATVQQAHKKFTPRKADRDKEIESGWVVRREEPGDREAFAAAIAELAKEAEQ
ncbi:hypothetical protein NDR87_18840 [Nocardia sp. CDC159]|uniref:Uncharacterized protein n=1 Tax=Nocardia pulmonis TaxID=2951408 RepID=A0A9X2E8T2_9NOCA|nr:MULTISPECIES: hypothetical protein [Nocardia]MCM6776252.1 hypothetical protein [Nocardia pulmonis]MCM6788422.1 hypothetical protein [Nocardia sp. CDC159]